MWVELVHRNDVFGEVVEAGILIRTTVFSGECRNVQPCYQLPKFLFVAFFVGPMFLHLSEPTALAEDEFLGRSTTQWTKALSADFQLDRIAAVKALGVLKATPSLNDALGHKDPVIRYWAAIELGRGGQLDDVSNLKAALEDPAPYVRVAAAEAFCHLGKPEVGIPVLVTSLQHPLDAVRLAAISSLEAIGPQAIAAQEAIDEATSDSQGYVVRIAERLSEKFAEKDKD